MQAKAFKFARVDRLVLNHPRPRSLPQLDIDLLPFLRYDLCRRCAVSKRRPLLLQLPTRPSIRRSRQRGCHLRVQDCKLVLVRPHSFPWCKLDWRGGIGQPGRYRVGVDGLDGNVGREQWVSKGAVER